MCWRSLGQGSSTRTPPHPDWLGEQRAAEHRQRHPQAHEAQTVEQSERDGGG